MSSHNPSIKSLLSQLDACMCVDKHKLRRRIHGCKKLQTEKLELALLDIEQDVQASIQKRQQRQQDLPDIEYPQLPVSEHKEAIAEAIQNNQVVIIAGETGSGKTTQIPKICMELGRGVSGLIGHTQPRRLAARSVASRIAEELG